LEYIDKKIKTKILTYRRY